MKDRNQLRKCCKCEERVSLQFAIKNWKKLNKKNWICFDCFEQLPKSKPISTKTAKILAIAGSLALLR